MHPFFLFQICGRDIGANAAATMEADSPGESAPHAPTHSRRGLLIGIIILLIILAVVLLWRRKRRLALSVNCGVYPPGPVREMCLGGLKLRDDRKGRRVAGARMPVVWAAYAYSRANSEGLDTASLFNRAAPHMAAPCAENARGVDPEVLVSAVNGFRRRYGPLEDPHPYNIKWSSDSGQKFTNAPPPMEEMCTPLCPRPECYADMDCGPQGYCQSYFPDDPTYGGRCAPS
jgi:hypothetical protein